MRDPSLVYVKTLIVFATKSHKLSLPAKENVTDELIELQNVTYLIAFPKHATFVLQCKQSGIKTTLELHHIRTVIQRLG